MRVSCTLVRDDNGGPLQIVLQTEDVTQARQVEQDLAREQRLLAESQEAGRIGSWELDLETGVQRWSREQCAIYGVDAGCPAPQLDELLTLIHPDDRASMLASLRTNMESGATFTDEYRVAHPALGTRTLVVRGRYLPRDPDGTRPARLAGTTHDVTAERETEAARWALAERQRLLLASLPDALVALFDKNLDCALLQGEILAKNGIDPSDFLGRQIGETFIGEDARRITTAIRRALTGSSATVELILAARTYQMEVWPYRLDDNSIAGAFAVGRDITERVRSQEQLRERERQLFDAQALAHVGSWDRHVSESRLALSAELCRILGQPLGFSPTEDEFLALVHEHDRPAFLQALARATQGQPGDYEYRIVRPDGEIRYVHELSNPRRDAGGAVTQMFAAVQDITERKRYEAELERLATHDELTGLANRRTFDHRIADELARAKRYGHGLSLVLMDIDHFKRINDSLGHPVGDRVLVQIAQTLRTMVRERELIARVGGEEFAWILPEADAAGALAAVKRAFAAVAASQIDDVPPVTLSAGICAISDGLEATELYRRADNALLRAKHTGRDRIVRYSADCELPAAPLGAPRSSTLQRR